MIWLKACQKCSGDMHFDLLVEEYVCLQCGQSVDRLPASQTEPPACMSPAGVAPSAPPRDEKKR
jgi:hypothetical protein